MGILFTILMGFLFTITMGFLFTMVLGIQLTISTGWKPPARELSDTNPQATQASNPF
jgi:ABC-type nitrate/sulfonate/bicarbonate transport system permease component